MSNLLRTTSLFLITTATLAACGGNVVVDGQGASSLGGGMVASSSTGALGATTSSGFGGSSSGSSSSRSSGGVGTVLSTLNLAGQMGYLLSNTACGGSCNIGGTDQQQATYACQQAGYSSDVTYTVATAPFYPCWCLVSSSCCSDNPGIQTSPMITSVTCQ